MLKLRVISFAVLLGVFAFIYFGGVYGTALFMLLAAAVAAAMTKELADMLEKVGAPSFGKASAALVFLYFSVGFSICVILQRPLSFTYRPAMAAAAVIAGAALMLNSSDFTAAVKRLATSVFVVAVPFMMVSCMAGVFIYRSAECFVWFVLATKAGDTGAYCAGMLCNRVSGGKNHKIAPKISPNKSVEGAIGGLILSVAVSVALGTGWLGAAWGKSAAAGAALFLGGFFGDLTESAFKRGCGVKDSGSILPGMGGVWDVMDSFIYNAPLFTCYLGFLW